MRLFYEKISYTVISYTIIYIQNIDTLYLKYNLYNIFCAKLIHSLLNINSPITISNGEFTMYHIYIIKSKIKTKIKYLQNTNL